MYEDFFVIEDNILSLASLTVRIRIRFNIILPYQQQRRNSLFLELIFRKPQMLLRHALNTVIYCVVLITLYEICVHGSAHRHSILIRSNKMQQMQVFIIANLLYMFRVSIDPIIRSTSNCNYSFWYRSYHVSGQQPSASVAFRPRWQKIVALTRDMTCTRSCSYSLMYS